MQSESVSHSDLKGSYLSNAARPSEPVDWWQSTRLERPKDEPFPDKFDQKSYHDINAKINKLSFWWAYLFQRN